MFMPFVRLIAIYIIVGLAVFAFFKRDAITALIAGPEVETVRVSDLVAAQQPAAPAVVVEETAPTPEPVYAPVGATEVEELVAPVVVEEPADMETRLGAARQAFWNGDRDEAEALYVALVTDFPSEAIIVGELGNLYYNSGRRDEAAAQYHVVGILALEAGNNAQAMSMIGVLQSIAPDLATDLRTRTGQ